MDLATNGDMRIAAETMRQFYRELKRTGFTEKQAMELCVGAITGSRK